jgi:FixJ family two-component response regulator
MTHGAKVHVVEDDASLRTALVRLLGAAGFEARAYASAGEFLVADRGDAPGCLLLDVALPGLSGLELQAALAREHDPIPIVFLTGHGDIPMSVDAMKAGAVDFLTKPVKRERLLSAVDEALARDAQKRERGVRSDTVRSHYERLTARERDVFDRVIRGKLNKQIACEIGTSVRTVKAHRAQVMRKMEVTSVADLVHAAAALADAS